VDQDKVKHWMERGATPSDTVRALLKQAEASK
jgi:small subunit ribosomal protein S16